MMHKKKPQLAAFLVTITFAFFFISSALLHTSSTLQVDAATAPFVPSSFRNSNKGNSNQIHSLLLQSHRQWYALKTPHDTKLYDILNVRSNATQAEIQKSYRRLSREWHPDKVLVRKMKRERELVKQQQGGEERSDCSNANTTTSTLRPPPPPPPPPPLPPDSETDCKEEEYARDKLAELTQAYEILSDDLTRLLYHRYGIVDGPEDVVRLLNGRMRVDSTMKKSSIAGEEATNGLNGDSSSSSEQGRLMELMGYPIGGFHTHHHHHHTQHRHNTQHRQRLHYLTATITEKLRPLVEGTVSQELFVENIYQECNSLKKSALGAQILRCVGRAYRVEGYRVLRMMEREKRQHGGHQALHWRRRRHSHHKVTDLVRDRWRDAKHLCSAALASTKLAIAEQKLKRVYTEHERRKEQRKTEREERRIVLARGGIGERANGNREELDLISNIGALPGEEEVAGDDFDTGMLSDDEEGDFLDEDNGRVEEELRHLQHQKAIQAILSVSQMEALWKITKIELDQTVRCACQWILSPTDYDGQWHSFFPSEQSPFAEDWQHHTRHCYSSHRSRYSSNQRHDGWVGTTGESVSMEVGRLRAAAALVLVGDIMVECSKEGTSWK
jgi:curved DNA-binding protein CbpA